MNRYYKFTFFPSNQEEETEIKKVARFFGFLKVRSEKLQYVSEELNHFKGIQDFYNYTNQILELLECLKIGCAYESIYHDINEPIF